MDIDFSFAFPGIQSNDRVYGMVIGIVTNNKDPDKLGRVKVRFPALSAEIESNWARIATPMAGKERGLFFLPEVDDEVLVGFENGHINFPYVLGALWNGKDQPPETNDDGKNDKRTIKSRSGHIIRFDDKDGEEKIEILDKTGKNTIIIDAAKNKITIQADSDITIQSSNGKLTFSGKDVEIKSQAAFKVEAGTDLDMKSNTSVKIEANATMDLKASGTVNVKGSMVKIN
ncbi:MAG: phage tail protein [Anaerolineaceae bacterium]|nr:phage tail protein [Anaerolineaceae bacterium]